MNHHGTLEAHDNSRRGRRRNDGRQADPDPAPFDAFGGRGEGRAPRRTLNTAAASAAANAHRSAANDFWAANQGWADSEDAAWAGPPQPGGWSGNGWRDDSWRGDDGGCGRDNKPAWHSDPDWNTHQSWSEAQTWSATPVEQDPGPQDYPAESGRYGRPGTLTAALQNRAAAEEPEEEPRQSRSRGMHRVTAPPSALKGRAAVVAVAAGAVVAAGQCATAAPGQQEQQQETTDYEAAGAVHEIAAQSSTAATEASAGSHSPQMLSASEPLDSGQFGEMLANGAQFAQDLAAAEAAKFRPLFSNFANGSYTSGFGARWGVQHLGIDVAAPIGTPIYAVADGEVIDAGPAAGFGMWVRLMHADGTVTVYGHVDTTTVSMGEYVLAGDQIATMGNRGFSTGPHVHFEVWLNGSDKIDPIPWLATRGIGLTGNAD